MNLYKWLKENWRQDKTYTKKLASFYCYERHRRIIWNPFPRAKA